MKPNSLTSLLFLAMAVLLLSTCQKTARDNPWDDLAKLDPQEWTPKNLLIEAPGITERTITWVYNGDSRIEGFKIDRKKGNDNWVLGYAKLEKDSRSLTDTISPDLNTTYYYKVYSYAGAVKSNELEFNTPAAIPTPTDLTLEKINDVSYKLNWNDNAIGESGFIIERKTAGPEFIVLDTITANTTTYIDPNVFTGKAPINVQYQVTAFYGHYLSEFASSNINAELLAPDNLVITKNTVSSVTISWKDNSSGESGFIIERKQAEGIWEVLSIQSDSNYTDQSFLLNTDVTYRVAAFYDNIFSDFATGAFNSKIPDLTNIQIIRNTIISATLSWDYNLIGIQGFQVYRKVAPNDWELVSDQTSTSFIDNTFELNDLINYKVIAYYSSFQSAEVEISFNSQIPAPINLTYTTNSTNYVTLEWEYNITGNQGFILERKTNDGAWSVIAPSINPNTNNFIDDQIHLDQNIYAYRLSSFVLNDFSDYAEIFLSLPTVITANITSPTTTTAVGGGNITYQGSTPISQKGVCWSISPNPDIYDNMTNDGVGIGSFSSMLTGLSPITLYYVRAYAINDVGLAYGAQISFTTPVGNPPTVTTSNLSILTNTTATAGGNVTSQGNTPVTQKGVCWSTSPSPDIYNNSTNDGSGIGSFSSLLTELNPLTTYYLRAYAINAAGIVYGSELIFTTLNNGEVYNPITGKVWKDRNLGASRVAQSSTDQLAFGDLYQWGRNTDGHEKRTSTNTSSLSVSDNPGHGKFILSPNSPYDWRSPQNNNLWQGLNGINNPCPNGYRLPTSAEWESERQSWNTNDAAGAFSSPLKLPMSGLRFYTSGAINYPGLKGYYWSSSINISLSRYLFFDSVADVISTYRSFGFSVRCIKD